MKDYQFASKTSIIVVSVMILLFGVALSCRNYKVSYTTYVATPDGMAEFIESSTIFRDFDRPTNVEAFEAAQEDAADKGFSMDSISVNYVINR